MQITKDYFDRITPPDFVLCKANRNVIGTIFGTSKKYERCFNDLDTITFTTPLFLSDGTKNPYYDALTIMKYILARDVGFFYIDSVKMTSEGTEKEEKEITAKSYEGLLSQKYLENFHVYPSEPPQDDEDILEDDYDVENAGALYGIKLYQPSDREHSLLHLILEKAPEWSIGHVDKSLQDKGWEFEVDKQDIYSFLMEELTDKAQCFVIFDTLSMTINVYADDLYGKDTHVYISYQNLLQNVNMNCNLSDIKTCLYVNGEEDTEIREINFGHPAIYNLDFYHSKEYMSDELYEDFGKWKQLYQEKLPIYNELTSQIVHNDFEELNLKTRLPSTDDDEHPKEEYNKWAFEDKYTEAIIKQQLTYYGYDYEMDGTTQGNTSPLGVIYNAISSIIQAKRQFKEANIVSTKVNHDGNHDNDKKSNFEICVYYDDDGHIHYESRTDKNKTTSVVSNKPLYAIDNAVVEKLNNILVWTQERIDEVTEQVIAIQERTAQLEEQRTALAQLVDMQNNLTDAEWKELSPFIREDEYTSEYNPDNDQTEEERIQTMEDMKNAANKELLKKSSPQLTFEAAMCNLFSLPEFADSYESFDIGNYIHVNLRDDFEVKARVLKLSINFYDMSDFSITFSNIMAKEKNVFTDIQDAINQATSATTSLTYGSGAWTKAARTASSINKILSDGLLDAGNYLKGTTDISEMKVDSRGIFVNTIPQSGEDSHKDSIYLGGGRILFSDDDWQTVREAIGRVRIDGESIFGVLADAVVAGTVYGSALKGNEITGGTIKSDDYESGKTGSFLNLADGTFEFNQNGTTCLAMTKDGLIINGMLTHDDLEEETKAYLKAIQNEATARQNADKTNSDTIANEITARKEADKVLSDSYATLDGKITTVDGKFVSYTTTTALANWLASGEQTTGFTQIKGGLIKTGFIASSKGESWINLDNGSFNFGGGKLDSKGNGVTNSSAKSFLAWDSTNGKLTISGELSSPTGNIGAFQISGQNLIYTNPSNTNQCIELGNSGIKLGKGNAALGGYNFSVDINGNVKAGNMICLSLQGSNITGQCGYSLSSDGHTRHDFAKQAVLKLGDAMITPYWIHAVNAALFGGEDDPSLYG